MTEVAKKAAAALHNGGHLEDEMFDPDLDQIEQIIDKVKGE